MIKNSTDTIIN